MLSRVADRIFWMSRLMARAENMARILGATSALPALATKEVQQQNLIAPLPMTGSTDDFFPAYGTVRNKRSRRL